MKELGSILKRSAGKRIRGGGLVWRLEGRTRAVERCKSEIVDSICSSARPFVRYDESPLEVAELRGSMEVAPGTWRLPPLARGDIVRSWLSPGNWQLYVAGAPVLEIPDLCRASDDEVESFVLRSGVSLVIDSFHDDVLWVIGVNSDPGPPAPEALVRAR